MKSSLEVGKKAGSRIQVQFPNCQSMALAPPPPKILAPIKKPKIGDKAQPKIVAINRVSRETEKRNEQPEGGGFLSSDGFLWTDTNPDVKLIEPPILVSVNYNVLSFHRKAERPPERRTILLVNHGDQPIAFQVQTTDNYSYMVDRKNGVIPPRQTTVNAVVQMPNAAVINVFRRPHSEYKDEEKGNFFNVPNKTKMSILLAPQMCQTFSPEAIFHNERCHEKLRVLLLYSGVELEPEVKQMLLSNSPGWTSWKDEGKQVKNAKQIAAFRKMEQTIIENASREVIDDPKKPAVRRVTPVSRHRTPTPEKRKDPGIVNKLMRHLNPFSKEDRLVKKQDNVKKLEKPKTPKKHGEPAAAVSPTRLKKSMEHEKKHVEVLSNTEFKNTGRSKEKEKWADQPSPKDAKRSRETKEKFVEAPTPFENRKSREPKDKLPPLFSEAPTPFETRKSKEQKDKEKVVEAPKSKSWEAHTPPQHHKKSIEKSHTVSPGVHTPKANSPQTEMKTMKPPLPKID